VAKYRLGILGGGQLARMSVMAAQRMGVTVVSLDEDPNSPAAQVGPFIVGSIHDAEAIAQVMAECDVVTFENEFIKANTLRLACQKAGFPEEKVIPGINTLETIQDKFLQREAYMLKNVNSPKAVPAERASELGFPCVLKARYGGYDGKGTRYANTEAEYESLRPIWEGGGWLAEQLVSFDNELAVMVVVGQDGTVDSFPTVVTRQKNYVCDLVYPCDDPELDQYAQDVARSAVRAVHGVGLFGVELFQQSDDIVSVNEIAPRPHNTGHYSLDWGGISQFEAHVQVAVGSFAKVTAGLPACMANILGVDGVNDLDRAIDAVSREHPDTRFHWYGKKEAKPGRKMGHLTVCGEGDIIDQAERARETFYRAWTEA